MRLLFIPSIGPSWEPENSELIVPSHSAEGVQYIYGDSGNDRYLVKSESLNFVGRSWQPFTALFQCRSLVYEDFNASEGAIST